MKSTAMVGVMTLVSRILGFVRDMVIARYFGADAATDAFFVAFRIPNFLRRLLAEGSFAQAFVPLLSECRENHDRAGLRLFLGRAAGSLALLALGVSLLGMLAAPLLIALFAPGFIGQDAPFDLSASMLRVTFPYLFFVTLTAFAGGVLNAFGRFAIPALTPAVLNLVMIAAALWLAPQMAEPVTALAWGVLLAGAAQLALQIPALLAAGLLPRPRVALADPAVARLLRGMAPAIFGVSVTQVNVLVDTLLASFLASGSVSWLYYSDRLVEFPLGVFGVAIGTAILPHLAKHHAQGDAAGFSRALDWGLRWVLLIGLPATVGLMALAQPLMSTLFEYDEFGSRDVAMAGRSLMTYSSGLVGFIAVKVLAAGFNARHDLQTPVRHGLWAMAANLLLGVALVLPTAELGFGHAALALATALAALLNAALLLRGLLKAGVLRPNPGWPAYLARLAAGNAGMGALLVYGAAGLPWSAWGAQQRIVQLALWIGLGGLAYFAALWLLGLRPAHLALREAA
ncbi:MAG: murein biosynthesis integral membrane protein MurJ [Candidatus Methylumidiphilus sp.]